MCGAGGARKRDPPRQLGNVRAGQGRTGQGKAAGDNQLDQVQAGDRPASETTPENRGHSWSSEG